VTPVSEKAKPLSDEFRFLRGAITRPRAVGAIAPSSPALARAIAAQIDPDLPGPILELGPGTGVVTEALIARGISQERLIAIEFDPDFTRLITARYPKARVIAGDAFDLDSALGPAPTGAFAAIISGLPLLNHSPGRRTAFIDRGLRRLKVGAPLVQFSYGFGPPADAPPGAIVTQTAYIWRNLPPARVWVYRRA
jgi:phosphatidylethanolamine/phosphatidyl-N-methylethanolamine N-methyltransferase